MSDELRDLIAQTASNLNPETQDNQEFVETTEDEDIFDKTLEDEINLEEEIEGLEDSEDEVTEPDDSDSSKFTVKVNGKEFEVSEEELKAGYQRQADYTRDKQAIKLEREEVESIKAEYAKQFEAITELDAAWEENPIAVLTHFTTSTENPTQAVAMLIRDLAAANVLDREFLDMFGITPDVQRDWRQQSEVEKLTIQNSKATSTKEEQLKNAQMELEVQKAIMEYDNQIDDIIDREGLNFNTKQRTAFRQELAQYAADNELTNLKAAYKAFKYEESQNKKAFAAKTAERAKAKKATNVVSRSGTGEGSPVSDTTDLNSVIRAAMKESQGS